MKVTVCGGTMTQICPLMPLRRFNPLVELPSLHNQYAHSDRRAREPNKENPSTAV